jgi:hypothetical protein
LSQPTADAAAWRAHAWQGMSRAQAGRCTREAVGVRRGGWCAEGVRVHWAAECRSACRGEGVRVSGRGSARRIKGLCVSGCGSACRGGFSRGRVQPPAQCAVPSSRRALWSARASTRPPLASPPTRTRAARQCRRTCSAWRSDDAEPTPSSAARQKRLDAGWAWVVTPIAHVSELGGPRSKERSTASDGMGDVEVLS